MDNYPSGWIGQSFYFNIIKESSSYFCLYYKQFSSHKNAQKRVLWMTTDPLRWRLCLKVDHYMFPIQCHHNLWGRPSRSSSNFRVGVSLWDLPGAAQRQDFSAISLSTFTWERRLTLANWKERARKWQILNEISFLHEARVTPWNGTPGKAPKNDIITVFSTFIWMNTPTYVYNLSDWRSS